MSTNNKTIKAIKNNSCWYIHNGDKGILTYPQELKRKGQNRELEFFSFSSLSAKELDMVMGDPTIAYECYTSYTVNGEEIDYTLVVNEENDQHLIYAWVTVDHAIVDEWERDYIVITDSYYNWTSTATRYREKMKQTQDKKEIQKIYNEYVKEAKKAKIKKYDYPELLSLEDFDLPY